MIYTNPLQGLSQKITIGNVSKSLITLMDETGGGVIDNRTNLIVLYPIDSPSGQNELAWYSLDKDKEAEVNGTISYFGVFPIEVTQAQFSGFQIRSDGGADKDFYLQQFDSEGSSL